MAEHLDWTAGTDAVYTITLRDSSGGVLLNTYAGTETLTLSVWPGEDQEALTLAGSGVAWLSGPNGTLTLTLSRTETLDPGLYWLRVDLTDGGTIVPAYEAIVHVTAGPGTANTTLTYCTMADVYHYCPWIDVLIEASPTLRADLGSQRELARKRIDDLIISRAGDSLQEQYVRHSPVVATDPIIPTEGVDMGPRFGPSTIPNTSIRDHRERLRSYLDDDMLIVDARLTEAAARMSVAFACEYQIGQAPTGTSYQDLGKSYAKAARSLLRGWVARIDTDDDDVADIEIP